MPTIIARQALLAGILALPAPALAQTDIWTLMRTEAPAMACLRWLIERDAWARHGRPLPADPATAIICRPHLEALFLVMPAPPPRPAPTRPTDFRHTWGG
jgi:hypothetical protein